MRHAGTSAPPSGRESASVTIAAQTCLQCTHPPAGSWFTRVAHALGVALLRVTHASDVTRSREAHRNAYELNLTLETERRHREKTRLLTNRQI